MVVGQKVPVRVWSFAPLFFEKLKIGTFSTEGYFHIKDEVVSSSLAPATRRKMQGSSMVERVKIPSAIIGVIFIWTGSSVGKSAWLITMRPGVQISLRPPRVGTFSGGLLHWFDSNLGRQDGKGQDAQLVGHCFYGYWCRTF